MPNNSLKYLIIYNNVLVLLVIEHQIINKFKVTTQVASDIKEKIASIISTPDLRAVSIINRMVA